jgi:cytochrome c556
MLRNSAVVLAGLLLACTGCSRQDAPAPKQSDELFQPTASIQEIMNSIIDPNIDYVWNSVASVATNKGIEERKPATDEDWKAVKQHAIVVFEATNLLLIEGRHAAREGTSTSAAPTELSAPEIDKLIAANHAEFITYAHALHETVGAAITAIEKKDADQLVEAGSAIDSICEQCHKKFWYPNDKRPPVPVFPKKP